VTFFIGALFAAAGLLMTTVVLRAPAREVAETEFATSSDFDMSELEALAG
jgi:hypothetical protein